MNTVHHGRLTLQQKAISQRSPNDWVLIELVSQTHMSCQDEFDSKQRVLAALKKMPKPQTVTKY